VSEFHPTENALPKLKVVIESARAENIVVVARLKLTAEVLAESKRNVPVFVPGVKLNPPAFEVADGLKTVKEEVPPTWTSKIRLVEALAVSVMLSRMPVATPVVFHVPVSETSGVVFAPVTE
jgi:hypothetical protein